MMWQTYTAGRQYQRLMVAGPCFVRSFWSGASGAIILTVAGFWCSLTGMSSMTGGGDIEELEDES